VFVRQRWLSLLHDGSDAIVFLARFSCLIG